MVADHEVRARPEVPITDRILVPFKAEGGGVDELSWGQQELWLVMRRRRVWIPLGSHAPLPAGTTVDHVVAKLRFMMARYPPLRTRLRFDRGGTRQVVAYEGDVPLAIADVAAGADPAAVAQRLSLQFMDGDYDFATDWPIRMAVVRHRGLATHQVVVMCHLAIDGTGAAIMAAELADWVPATGDTTPPPAAVPPLEQVRRQRLPAARRQSDAAMSHWANILRSAPAGRLRDLGEERRPRYWKGHLRSPATRLAARSITSRTGADSASVLLALYAVALARMTGVSPVLLQVVASNRFRPGLDDTVSPIAQSGLCLVDVAGMTVDEAVTAARRRRIATYKHAYYDPLEREELVARVAQDRGEELELGCYLNDRRLFSAAAAAVPAPDPTPGQVHAAVPRSSFEWTMLEDVEFTEPLYLFVDESAEPPEAIVLEVSADTRHLSPAGMEALVRGMEAVAVDAAFDPMAPTRVPEPG